MPNFIQCCAIWWLVGQCRRDDDKYICLWDWKSCVWQTYHWSGLDAFKLKQHVLGERSLVFHNKPNFAGCMSCIIAVQRKYCVCVCVCVKCSIHKCMRVYSFRKSCLCQYMHWSTAVSWHQVYIIFFGFSGSSIYHICLWRYTVYSRLFSKKKKHTNCTIS